MKNKQTNFYTGKIEVFQDEFVLLSWQKCSQYLSRKLYLSTRFIMFITVG